MIFRAVFRIRLSRESEQIHGWCELVSRGISLISPGAFPFRLDRQQAGFAIIPDARETCRRAAVTAQDGQRVLLFRAACRWEIPCTIRFSLDHQAKAGHLIQKAKHDRYPARARRSNPYPITTQGGLCVLAGVMAGLQRLLRTPWRDGAGR